VKNPRILIAAIGFCTVAIAVLIIRLSLPSQDLQPSDVKASESKNLGVGLDVSGLTGKNLQDREKAAEAIRKQRAELIKMLVGFAAEKVKPLPSSDPRFIEYPWHDSKHLATLLLGDLRAVEAVPVLLENLEYKNPRTLIVTLLLDIGGQYPAAEALSKVGMPAVKATIDKLSSSTTSGKGSEICCWILKKILGVRLARLRLQIAIEETRDEAVKKNLSTALPYFKTD
jgi:hypothetical protein